MEETIPQNIGKVDTILADTGYFSEANVDKYESEQVIPLSE
jgi:hypothetical protein